MNEEQIRVQAAMAELKAHNDWLVNRCVNMAAELVALTNKVKELEVKPTNEVNQ